MPKHVPGPWEVCENPKNDNWYAGITIGAADPKDARRICDLANWHPETREANGRLICAAPDLLGALQALLDHYLELVNSGDAGFWDPEKEFPVVLSRAAIAKVTGNDPL